LEVSDRILTLVDEVDVEEDYDYEDYEEEPDEDELLLVWGLVKSLNDEMAPHGGGHTRRIYLVSVDEGLPVEIYPPNEELLYELTYDSSSADNGIVAEEADNGDVRVYVPLDTVRVLGETARRGEGEKAVVEELEEAEALYRLARALASLYTSDKLMRSYLAYKSILKLRLKGAIVLPDEILEYLPLEEVDVKQRVKRQLSEELGLLLK